MGRQVIGQSTNYGKLKNLLLSVVVTLGMLTCVRIAIYANLDVAMPRDKNSGGAASALAPTTKVVFRPIIKPSRLFTAKLTRSTISNSPLIDMNDRGDFLYLVSPPEAAYKQFVHFYHGKSVTSDKVSFYSRWTLTPNGSIVKKIDLMMQMQTGRSNWGYTGYAFNELRFFRRMMDDGSIYFVNSNMKKKVLISELLNAKDGNPNKVIYSSHKPLMMLDIDKSGAIWLRELLDPQGLNNDQLLKVTKTGIEKVPFPPGYHCVERVTNTGSMIAGTFGHISDTEPVRSYVHEKSGWRELPLPVGSVFSYVQKIFDNGLILGFVTDEKREKMLQVVWNGDSVSILNECPAWPKLGQFSFVTRATAKGDIYVRNVMNTEAGTSENYLMSVGP